MAFAKTRWIEQMPKGSLSPNKNSPGSSRRGFRYCRIIFIQGNLSTTGERFERLNTLREMLDTFIDIQDINFDICLE